MFSKSNVISTIVTGIWAFMGGYLLWGILCADLLNENLGSASGVGRETPDYVHLGIGCLILALVFSTIYKKWGAGDYGIGSGLQFGIFVGVMTGFGSGLIDFSTTNIYTITGSLINGVIYAVFFAIMGILAGLIFSKVK